MTWVLNSDKVWTERVSLFNMSMNPGPSIEEYVDSIARVSEIKVWIPQVPSFVLLAVAHMIDIVARPLGINHLSPVWDQEIDSIK